MDAAPSPSPRRVRSRRILLQLITDQSATTRAELVAATGLSGSAVAAGVADLLERGLVVEQPIQTPAQGRGRRPTQLRPARPEGHVIGVDFGHSHVRVALASTTGDLLDEAAGHIDVDAEAVAALDLAATLVETVLERTGLARDRVLGVAAGIPGPLSRHGKVASPTILHSWIDLDPAAELERRFLRPVSVENDADMGAIGERRYGAAGAYSDFIYIKASHGVGASIMLGGQIYRGATGTAGEIGHTHLPGSTNRCRCGKQGCLEASISVTEVRRQLEHTYLHSADAEDTIPARVAADPIGARILSDAGRVVGRIVADGCNWLNPQAVVLGGELGVSGPAFADGVRESLDRYAQTAAAAAVTVVPAALNARSELMGAVAVAIDRAATL